MRISADAAYGTFLRKYNDLARQAAPLLSNTRMLDNFDINNVRGIGNTTWPEQKALFEVEHTERRPYRSLFSKERSVMPKDETQI